MKKTILSLLLLAAGCFSASAQQATEKEVFNPHWYVQGQVGAQYTLGEVKFGDLISPNAQIAVGYNFTKVWGARLTVGAWQSKGGIEKEFIHQANDIKYKWNYVAPTLNATFNVTNAIFGYNPNRVVDFGLFAGVGANIAWNNKEANDARANAIVTQTLKDYNGNAYLTETVDYMEHIWDGTKARLVGQFGANIDFKVSKRVALGLEVNCNIIGDQYNSKHAPNADWYFNGLAGVKVALGNTTKTEYIEPVKPVIIEKEKIVKVPVHDTVYVDKQIVPEKIRRDIFFTICKSDVTTAEMPKVEDVVAYLNKYPNAKVSVTGYADKGTGNAKVNVKYAKSRAEKVAKLLQSKFGISASRIIVDSKGDTVQPYEENDLNRVTICIAE